MSYIEAKEKYALLGVDTDKAIEILKTVPISLHCWQGDDVIGFDNDGGLTGGIQTTGNYIGRARTPDELMSDMDKVISLTPGKLKLNLHASYAIFDGDFADRNKLEPKHFTKWVQFAKERNMGIDFNPTFFSHSMVKDNLTLSSPDETVRQFWVEHGKCCLKIAEYFANETGIPCVMNIWIPDGYKDVPADRFGPRERFKKSLDEILSISYDKSKVFVCLESKVFGIGMESYTVGSAEFCMNYVANKGITPLMDNGHYHPTEMVSDKISSMLLFNNKIALHITRGVRWDSDHVVILDDETKEIAKEIVRADALDRVFIATDYFDATELIGKIFIVTGTGKYFKNVKPDPENNLGIIRIAKDGTTAELLWRYADGGKFTSELPAHLMSHMARLKVDPENRVVMHSHPTNTLAMNYVHELDEKKFTHTLWEMCTECIVVFPDGIGVLPWMLCGTNEIGEATARKMEEFRLVIWGMHGIYGAGKTMDETFGLIETVEKAAQIYMLIAHLPRVNTIKDIEMQSLAEFFGVDYRKDFLNL